MVMMQTLKTIGHFVDNALSPKGYIKVRFSGQVGVETDAQFGEYIRNTAWVVHVPKPTTFVIDCIDYRASTLAPDVCLYDLTRA